MSENNFYYTIYQDNTSQVIADKRTVIFKNIIDILRKMFIINNHDISRHTYGGLTAHQCAAAHRLGNAALGVRGILKLKTAIIN